MKKIIPLICGMACLLFAKPAIAQTTGDSVTAAASSLTAAPFLRMNTDIRSAGIGESAIALPGDNATHYANPARMVQVKNQSSIAIAYTPWMTNLVKNVALYSVSGFYKTSANEVISGGIRYFKQGELKQTDDYGQVLGQSNPYDMAIDASYARKLSDQLYIGATFRYIYSHIINSGYAGYQNGTAVAADLGLYYQTKENAIGQSWHMGAVITNVGSKIKYSDASNGYALPSTAGLAVTFQQKLTEEDRLIFTADAVSPLTSPVPGKSFFQDRMQYNFGGEYGYHSMLFIRAGYSSESTEFSGFQFVTTGLGLGFKACRLDLAYLIPTGSGTTSTMSSTFKLGLSFIIK
jgi:Type IX secretion system protein PorV